MQKVTIKHIGKFAALSLLAGLAIAGCRKAEEFGLDNFNEQLAGGAMSVMDASGGAYTHAFMGLSASDDLVHDVGDAAFEATFVTAPAPINSGLGPLYNNVSCASCHAADGRGRAPMPGERLASVLLRMSVPGTDVHGGPLPVPGFGAQMQHQSIFGHLPEANISVSYDEHNETLADGTTVKLRQPIWVTTQAYTSLPGNVQYSARLAPPVFGLGLLEAVDEGIIRASADEGDANGDGISGRPNEVWDAEHNRMALGRFGWKANTPTLATQTASAYQEDMGITTPIFRNESTFGQPQDDGFHDDPELIDSLFRAVTFYMQTLAVPMARNVTEPRFKRGKALFMAANCSGCHTPVMRTGTNVRFAQLSNQVIRPYTDLLLHDMGEGLADHRPDFRATGSEWRTAPLWGIGLAQKVNGNTNYLHDGRARNLTEAILWHGGEAEASATFVKALSKVERDDLLYFLQSL